ncbi:potassium channel family protein [Streptomyces sp. C10-9-1]|uniref:potassium channel family protein n=1 Tax=Streptomyces sp. C10-9-1 TaxID=1859285 RepID=UPI0035ABD217
MRRPRPLRRLRDADPAVRWSMATAAVALMAVAYFLLPIDHLGPQRPLLSWGVFCVALVSIALLLLHQIRNVILDRPHARPALAIMLLVSMSVVVFAGAYQALAQKPGEFSGLATRVDALYFTVVTLATVGYGDIVPTGQTARVVAVVQILYNVVFLTAATTTVSRRVRSQVSRRLGRQAGPAEDEG